MATASLGCSGNRLTSGQIARRKEEAALAALKTNGVDLPPGTDGLELDPKIAERAAKVRKKAARAAAAMERRKWADSTVMSRISDRDLRRGGPLSDPTGVKTEHTVCELKREQAMDDLGITRANVPSEFDFQSRPDAQPMGRSDIANAQFLSLDDARNLLMDIARECPIAASVAMEHVAKSWGKLLNNDERFVLTALGARRTKAFLDATAHERAAIVKANKLERTADQQ